jgi:SdrD B-like protein
MSQEQIQVIKKTQRLLDGPLKHVKAAALAAVLVPLASVFVAPASAQNVGCQSGGICGFVWNDTNGDGIQNAGEPPIEGATVFLVVGADTLVYETGPDGFYYFAVSAPGTYPIGVTIPLGTQPSPLSVGADAVDSNGVSDTHGSSVTTVTFLGGANSDTDFGFFTTAVRNPGTGTPGYWKNHPEAWPLPGVTIGGVYYPKATAIIWLGKVGKDKTTTMFSSLVSAKLNVVLGNDPSCVAGTIVLADLWMTKPLIGYGPVGSGVMASSPAWTIGEPLHQWMDAYNNGLLCAPHRN